MERKYIAIVELEEGSALREQWPFFGGCDGCIADSCYEDCEINKFPISRQEAIERMAKGIARIFDPYHPTKEEYESIWAMELLPSTQKHFRKEAEAALNALLEVEK